MKLYHKPRKQNFSRLSVSCILIFLFFCIQASGCSSEYAHVIQKDNYSVSVITEKDLDKYDIKVFDKEDENIYDMQILSEGKPVLSFSVCTAEEAEQKKEKMISEYKNAKKKSKDGKSENYDITEVQTEDTSYSIVSDKSGNIPFHAVFAFNKKNKTGMVGYSSVSVANIKPVLENMKIVSTHAPEQDVTVVY